MRVLQSSIYDKFLADQSGAKSKIDNLTIQMSSGKKIQKSYEDSNIYTQTLRFDSEISAYKDIQNRTEKSKMLADTSDSALNGMNDSLTNIKTKLVLASNGTLNDDNLKTIAIELRNERDNLVRLSNSSVNGQYVFSGTAVNVKPVSDDGKYHGNGESLKTQISKGMNVEYSVNGESLFFGFDKNINKSVSTNVSLKSQNPDDKNAAINIDNNVADLMGNDNNTFFYISGVKHDGEAFKSKVELASDEKISTLLQKIEDAYGVDEVEVSLNSSGNIIVKDLEKGNSKLDFQMVASDEDVNKISTLTSKMEFIKSNDTLSQPGVDDSAYFNIGKDHTLSSNVPLLVGDGKATASTKLSEISNSSLDLKTFQMNITDIDGNSKSVSINLSDNSTFTIDGTDFDIYNAVEDNSGDGVPTKADDFTLGQLENIISIAMSNKIPTANTKSAIDQATTQSKQLVDVGLNSDGALEVKDISGKNNDIKFSLYDKDADDFTKSSSMSFMSNKAVVATEAKVNFFKDLDDIIDAVENGIKDLGSDNSNPKNLGISNALSKIDVLTSHINKSHVKIGAITNNLDTEYAKAETMELNITELKSKVSDIDIADTVLEYQQVSLNYQAMMSTISKVNSLSLLNYMK